MICLPNQLPLLRFGEHELVEYESRWLTESIADAAEKAGHNDWIFANEIGRAVVEYLRRRFYGTSITLDQLFGKIVRMLKMLGWPDIASKIEATPPPIRISLLDLAAAASSGYELCFFSLLRDRLNACRNAGAKSIRLVGLRSAVKRLSGTKNWCPRCVAMESDVVTFIHRQFGQSNDGERTNREICFI